MSGIVNRTGCRSGIIGIPTIDAAVSDYEEGTWTATMTTGAGAMSLANTNCSYTKVGRVVHLTGAITLSSGTGSGSVQIGGIPYSTPSNSSHFNARSAGSVSGWGFTGSPTSDFHATISDSSNYFYIQDQGQNDVGAHVDSNTEFRFQLTYIMST